MATSVKKMKQKIKTSNYKNSWLLECSDIERPIAEKEMNVRWCLEHGAKANVKNSCGTSPLHAATRRDEACIVHMLIKYKADADTIDQNGETPLHLALRYGDGTAHILEPRSPEDIEKQRGDNTQDFQDTMRKVYIIDMLLENGADPNNTDSFGDTPLHVAVRSGEESVIGQLLQCFAKVDVSNSTGDTPLHLAAYRGEAPIVVALLERSAASVNTMNSTDNTPLHLAAHRGEVSVVQKLLDLHANVNVINIDGDTPLHLATCNERTKVVELLLTHDANVNARNNAGFTPLHAAADVGNADITVLLLKSKAIVDGTNNAGNTPLHIAVVRGHEPTIDVLLEHGVNVNIRNRAGDTLLFLAVVHRESATVELLLNRGANVEATSSGGNTPLHVAAYLGKTSVVNLLLKFKADVNKPDAVGNTALHLAARRRQAPVVSLLLRHGADIKVRNLDWNTPLTVARVFHFEGNEEVVSLLENAEKSLNPMVSPNDDGAQTLSDIFPSNQVVVYDSNLQTETVSKFQKKTDTSGLAGQLYETKLLTLVLIRALNEKHIEHFLIGTNVRGVGDMDDICMRYLVKGQDKPVMLFVQAKHREDREKAIVTVEDVRNDAGDYSLYKYFDSYFTIKDQFRVVSDPPDPMFKGEFGGVECNLVIYTPAKDCFTKKNTEHQVSEKVHYLIDTVVKTLKNTEDNTEDNTEVFQFDYDDDDVVSLSKSVIMKRIINLGTDLLKMIMSDSKQDLTSLITKYHVVMRRKVLKQCKEQSAIKEFRKWEFNPQFFESKCEYLITLKKTLVKELATKRCDQSKVINEDLSNFKLIVQDPCADTISQLIGKSITYDDKTKKLQLEEAFKKKFKSELMRLDENNKTLLGQFNEINISENVVKQAVKIKLAKMKFNLPLSFGNVDMTFRGTPVKVQKRMKAVADKLIELFKDNKDSTILDINDDVVGKGKKIEQGMIDINGGIGSAVGNLLVLDPCTKMLRFDIGNKNLPENAVLFLKELEAARQKQKLVNELSSYRIKMYVDGFPKYSLNGDEYSEVETLAKDYISKLWFYTNQAKQDEVEDIVKGHIDKYYNNENNAYQIKFQIHTDDIFRRVHSEVQEWWKVPKANYLTRDSDFFKKSKLECFNNLLLIVLNHIYSSKIYSIDFKLNPRDKQIDACIQAPTTSDNRLKILESPAKLLNTDFSAQTKDLVQNVGKLVNYYVAASSDPSMIENILYNKDSQGDVVVNILQNNVERQFDLDEFMFSKRSGTSGSSGQLYETKLLCLVLIRALNDSQIEDFLLGTNIRGIGDMDDICLRYRLKGQDRPIAMFLQAKHKESGHITVEALRNATGDFSLRKYFKSYLQIRNRFQANNNDSMFHGDFGDIDWNFIVYTPIEAHKNFTKRKTQHKVSEKVHYLINTEKKTKSFQFEYTKSDIDMLTKIIVQERLQKLATDFLNFLLSETDKSDVKEELIAHYHILLGREVLRPCPTQQEDNEFRMWEFNPMFFENNCEYLDTLKKTFVNVLSTNFWDEYKITDQDRYNFKLVLENPSASTISKLIGKLAIYNTNNKHLQLVKNFRGELMANDTLKMLAEKFNEIEVDENVINEAILMRLKTMVFKLPFSFGNLDMTICESETNRNEKVSTIADNFIKLLEFYKDKKIVEIHDVQTLEKTTEQSIKDVFSCIESAIGNLIVLDPATNLLKFDLDNEALPKNAALFLKELKDDRHKPVNEQLSNYRLTVNNAKFPKLSFHGDEHDERQVQDFLDKLWFYSNQAKEDEVELTLKDVINQHYTKNSQSSSTFCGSLQELIYLNSHENIQDWWMQTSESPYLTRASQLFEHAKEEEIGNLMLNVITFMYISNTSSFDIKFKQRVSKYFKFVQMHQIFNKMSGILFNLFDRQFNEAINIELPDIKEPLPHSNYSSLGELVFSLEVHKTVEWVAMKMWAVSAFTQYFLLAKAGPDQEFRKARDGFMLQQLCNGHSGHLIEGETDLDDIYSFVTTRFT